MPTPFAVTVLYLLCTLDNSGRLGGQAALAVGLQFVRRGVTGINVEHGG